MLELWLWTNGIILAVNLFFTPIAWELIAGAIVEWITEREK
jgi:hypothetical protein